MQKQFDAYFYQSVSINSGLIKQSIKPKHHKSSKFSWPQSCDEQKIINEDTNTSMKLEQLKNLQSSSKLTSVTNVFQIDLILL